MNRNPRLQSSILVAGELLLLISSSAWAHMREASTWPVWLFVILLGAGGYTLVGASDRRWHIAYGAGCVTAIGFGLLGDTMPLFKGLSSIAFAFSFYLLFRAVVKHCFFKSSVIQLDRILGGVAGYLLLGFFWMTQFSWATLANPDAFVRVATGEAATPDELLYFSFVTLMSLGYGDFVPTTSPARLIAMLNGLSGVLYLAMFVASLIGRTQVTRERS